MYKNVKFLYFIQHLFRHSFHYDISVGTRKHFFLQVVNLNVQHFGNHNCGPRPHWDEIYNKLKEEINLIMKTIGFFSLILFDFFRFNSSLSTVSSLQWMCFDGFLSVFSFSFRTEEAVFFCVIVFSVVVVVVVEMDVELAPSKWRLTDIL